jgi:hypothetical protein
MQLSDNLNDFFFHKHQIFKIDMTSMSIRGFHGRCHNLVVQVSIRARYNHDLFLEIQHWWTWLGAKAFKFPPFFLHVQREEQHISQFSLNEAAF